MLLDGVNDDLAMLHVLLGQYRQHVDQRLAVVRQIDQTGQVLARELLVFFVDCGCCVGSVGGVHSVDAVSMRYLNAIHSVFGERVLVSLCDCDVTPRM